MAVHQPATLRPRVADRGRRLSTLAEIRLGEAETAIGYLLSAVGPDKAPGETLHADLIRRLRNALEGVTTDDLFEAQRALLVEYGARQKVEATLLPQRKEWARPGKAPAVPTTRAQLVTAIRVPPLPRAALLARGAR